MVIMIDVNKGLAKCVFLLFPAWTTCFTTTWLTPRDASQLHVSQPAVTDRPRVVYQLLSEKIGVYTHWLKLSLCSNSSFGHHHSSEKLKSVFWQVKIFRWMDDNNE